jgi:hypothetical protein
VTRPELKFMMEVKMKKLIQILLFLLLAAQICFAQWYQQTSGTTAVLYSVSLPIQITVQLLAILEQS